MDILTEEQRARAASHAHVADMAARMYHTGLLDDDERLSAAGLGLVRAAAKWEPGAATFETYAIRAALCAIGRDCRARLRRPTVGLAAPEAIPGRGPGPREEAIGREERARLRDALALLTPRQRRVIGLYLGGMRWCDIAAELGISRYAIERLRARAVGRLRAELGAARP